LLVPLLSFLADHNVPTVETVSAAVRQDGARVEGSILRKPAERKTSAPAIDTDNFGIGHGHGADDLTRAAPSHHRSLFNPTRSATETAVDKTQLGNREARQ
jgi:hypothetical protein